MKPCICRCNECMSARAGAVRAHSPPRFARAAPTNTMAIVGAGGPVGALKIPPLRSAPRNSPQVPALAAFGGKFLAASDLQRHRPGEPACGIACRSPPHARKPSAHRARPWRTAGPNCDLYPNPAAGGRATLTPARIILRLARYWLHQAHRLNRGLPRHQCARPWKTTRTSRGYGEKTPAGSGLPFVWR